MSLLRPLRRWLLLRLLARHQCALRASGRVHEADDVADVMAVVRGRPA